MGRVFKNMAAKEARDIAMNAKIERVQLDLMLVYAAIESAAKDGEFSTKYLFKTTPCLDEYTLKDIIKDIVDVLENDGFKVDIIEYGELGGVRLNIFW